MPFWENCVALLLLSALVISGKIRSCKHVEDRGVSTCPFHCVPITLEGGNFTCYDPVHQMACGGKVREYHPYLGCCGSQDYGEFINTSQHTCCGDIKIPLDSRVNWGCCNHGSTYEKYNKDSDMCCGGQVHKRRDPNQECCGNTTFDKSISVCCQDDINPMNYEIASSMAGPDTPQQYSCCSINGKMTVYRNPEASLFSVDMCPEDIPPAISSNNCDIDYSSTQRCCAGEKINYPYGCCNGRKYLLTADICCDGRIHINSRHHKECCKHAPEGVIDRNTEVCCDGYPNEKTDTNVCCGPRAISSKEACCLKVTTQSAHTAIESYKSYTKSTEKCCGGYVVSQSAQCCGGSRWKMEANDICCPNHGPQTPSAISNHDSCCENNSGFQTYNHNEQKCAAGVGWVYNKRCQGNSDASYLCCQGEQYYAVNKNMKCCGSGIVDSRQQICCGNKVYNASPKIYKCNKFGNIVEKCRGSHQRKCGETCYYPQNEICCDGVRHYKPFGDKCCGNQSYYDWDKTCCDGKLHIYSEGDRCCGSRTYNVQTHRCQDGKKVSTQQSMLSCPSKLPRKKTLKLTRNKKLVAHFTVKEKTAYGSKLKLIVNIIQLLKPTNSYKETEVQLLVPSDCSSITTRDSYLLLMKSDVQFSDGAPMSHGIEVESDHDSIIKVKKSDVKKLSMAIRRRQTKKAAKQKKKRNRNNKNKKRAGKKGKSNADNSRRKSL